MTARSLVRRTPAVPAPGLGPAVWLKLENLQLTGSFKLRGAARKLDALPPASLAAGVIAASAGNHGAGLAAAGRAVGARIRVVVPALCPPNKRARIEGLGAEVVVHGDIYDQAEAFARAEAARTGALFVSAFDDDDIIEGNGGDLGRELIEQVPDLAAVVCPVGGGGMAAGLARALAPGGVRVIGVEPETNSAMRDSLAAGRAFTTYDGGHTCAEGCEGAVAERTFAIVCEHEVDVVTVSEAAIQAAVAWAYREAGQIIECSAAVAVAALRTGAVATRGPTGVIVTGGNIEPALLASLLQI